MCLADDETVTAANVCDHITPHRGDEAMFWSGPFQSLCVAHHNGRKQREERSDGTRIDINDINGLLD
jgi:5-methylcytosine-specific restriction protein A